MFPHARPYKVQQDYLEYIFSQKAAILETGKRIVLYEKRIKNVKNIEAALARFKEERSKRSGVFLDKDSLVKFVEELEYLAEKTGVEMEAGSVKFSKNSSGEKPVFVFKLTGDFKGIYQYLRLLENDVYLVKLERVNIQKLEESFKWNANLEVKLLSFLENET